MVVLECFVRMILLKVRGWLRIEIGEGVILIGWQRVFAFTGNFCRAPEGALARRIVSFFLFRDFRVFCGQKQKK